MSAWSGSRDARVGLAERGKGPTTVIEPVTGMVTLREIAAAKEMRVRPLTVVGVPME